MVGTGPLPPVERAEVVHRPPVAVRDPPDQRPERLPERHVGQQKEGLPIRGLEHGGDQVLRLLGMAQPEQFGHRLLAGGGFDGLGAGRRIRAAQPGDGTSQQIGEIRVGLDGRSTAPIRGQPHAHVVQQESAAEDECLGRVERGVVTAARQPAVSQSASACAIE